MDEMWKTIRTYDNSKRDFVRTQFSIYKRKYNLRGCRLNSYIGGMLSSIFSYNHLGKVITIHANGFASERTLIVGLLHETAHAIQDKAGVFDHHRYDKDPSYLWNIELAAERFMKREYNRHYRNKFGPIKNETMKCDWYFDMKKISVSNKTKKLYNDKMARILGV